MKLSCFGHRQSQPERILERIKAYNECLSANIFHVGNEMNQAFLLRKVLSKKLLWFEEAKAISYEANGIVKSAENKSSSFNSGDLENFEDRMIFVLRKSLDDHGLRQFWIVLNSDVDGILKRRRKEPRTKAADRLKPLNKKGETKAADRLKLLNEKEMKEMPSEINKAKKTIHVSDLVPTITTAETEGGVPPAQERLVEESMKAGDRLKMPFLKQEIDEVTFGKNKAKRAHVADLNPVLSIPEGEVSVLEGEAEHEAIESTGSEPEFMSEREDELKLTSKTSETEVMPLERNEAILTDFDVNEPVPLTGDEKNFYLMTEIEEMPFDRNEAILTYFDYNEPIPLTEDENYFNLMTEIEEVLFDRYEAKKVDVTGLTKMTPGLSVQDNLVSSSALENEWRPTVEIAESFISSKSEGMLSFHGEENVDKIPSGTTGFRFIPEIEVENIASVAELEGRMKPEQSEISVEPTVIETTSVKVRWPQFMDTELEIFQGDSSMKVQDVIKDRDNLFRDADYCLSIRRREEIEGSPKTGSDPSNIFKEDASLSGSLETPERTSFSLPKHSILRRVGAGLKEPPPTEWEQTSMVVLADNEFSSLPKKPNCPNLRFLFLQRNNRLRTIPDLFFDDMASLRVLDLSKTRITSLPPSLFKLTELQVLFLRECDCLDELPHEVGDLQCMEVLDLCGTELYDLPDDIGKLIFLKILQVSFYGSDDQSEYRNLPSKLVSDDFVSKFVALQALSIAVHPKDRRWNKIAETITKNVCMLSNLTYLEFYFPEVKFLSHFIESSPSWSNLQLKFKFVVGQNIKRIVSRVPDYIESEYNHQDRCLKFVNGSEKSQEVVVKVLNRATGFYLDHHLALCSLSEFGISNMEGLEFCLVRECPNIRVVIDNEERSERVLPSLRHLSIHYLWELEIIWKGPVTHGSLGVLKVMSVHTCPKLEFIISQSMLQGLSKLEELVVEDCVSLKEIISWDGNLVKDDFNVLPGLKKIKLHYLPELVSLWNGVLPLLKSNDIYGCPKLEGLS